LKNQNYDFRYKSSSNDESDAFLGTIEKDASGFFGLHTKEPFRGKEIIDKLLSLEFKTVIDIGAGYKKQATYLQSHGKDVKTCGYVTDDFNNLEYDYNGDFNTFNFQGERFDVSLSSHILEHQLNVNNYLKKISRITKNDGYIVIIVPPRKPFIIGGHVSIWNAGLVLYNLVLAGVDCSKECYIKQYDYNIGIIVKNHKFDIDQTGIEYNGGDIDKYLKKYFPFEVHDGFNGDIMEYNW
jgi:SAM-dependent methyltransferase